MLKKFIVFFIAAIIFLLVLGRDYILKQYLMYHLANRLGVPARFEKIHSYFWGVTVNNFSLSSEALKLEAKRAGLVFSWFAKTGFYAEGVDIKLKDIQSVAGYLKGIFAPAQTKKRGLFNFLLPPRIKLIDWAIKFHGDEKNNMDFSLAFSLEGRLKDGVFHLDFLRISGANLRYDDNEITSLTLSPAKNIYNLAIKNIKIKKRRIDNVMLSLKIEGNSVIFTDSYNPIFGPSAEAWGILVFDKLAESYISFHGRRVSLDSLVSIFADKKDIRADGIYDGRILIKFAASGLNEIRADFNNFEGGFINIYKEDSFSFLKKYLTDYSYNVLIASLKDYKYNKSTVTLGKLAGGFICRFIFDSDKQGRRDVPINFYLEPQRVSSAD